MVAFFTEESFHEQKHSYGLTFERWAASKARLRIYKVHQCDRDRVVGFYAVNTESDFVKLLKERGLQSGTEMAGTTTADVAGGMAAAWLAGGSARPD